MSTFDKGTQSSSILKGSSILTASLGSALVVLATSGRSIAQYRLPADPAGFRPGSYIDQDPNPGTATKNDAGKTIAVANDHIKDWFCNDQPNLSYSWCQTSNGKKATTYNGHGGWDIIRGWDIYDDSTEKWQVDVGILAPVSGVIEHAERLECPTDTCTDATAKTATCKGCGGGFGNNVKIRDRFGNQVILGHMRYNSIPTTLTIGSAVSCGQTALGLVGSSGYSTTPHIHFQVNPTGLGTPSEEPFAGDCKSNDPNVRHASLWTEQPRYCTVDAGLCYDCDVEPGARRHTNNLLSAPLWYAVNYGATGDDSHTERQERQAFQHAYGYRYYLVDGGDITTPTDQQPPTTEAASRLGCPLYVDSKQKSTGSSFVHQMIGSDATLFAQDFFQSDANKRFPGSPGDTALVYRAGTTTAFLLRNEFWGIYKCLKQDPNDTGSQPGRTGGAKWLGAPTGNQHAITAKDECPSGTTVDTLCSGTGSGGRLLLQCILDLNDNNLAPQLGRQVQYFEKGYMSHLADGVLRIHMCDKTSENAVAESAKNCGVIDVVAPNPPTGLDVCNVGDSKTCSTSPSTVGIGVCQAGISICAKGSPTSNADWGPCLGEIVPDPNGENCLGGIDNDCDGTCGCDDPHCAGKPCSPQGCTGQGGGGGSGGAGGSGGCATCTLGEKGCVDQQTSKSCGFNGVCNTWTALPCPQTPTRSYCKTGSGCAQCGPIMQDCCPFGALCDGTLQCQGGSCLTGSGGSGGAGGAAGSGGASGFGGGCNGICTPGSVDWPCFVACGSSTILGEKVCGSNCAWQPCSYFPKEYDATYAPTGCTNGVDDDCDGLVDCADPDCLNAAACGPKDAGTDVSVDACVPSVEVCNGKDDNCNGQIDEGNPGGGGACGTGKYGVCAAGTNACQSGAIVCQQTVVATPEVCDGKDNDCNGAIDDIPPYGSCSAGVGACLSAGQMVCMSGSTVCNAAPGTPTVENCSDGIDNDCDGALDCADPDCASNISCAPQDSGTDSGGDSGWRLLYTPDGSVGTVTDIWAWSSGGGGFGSQMLACTPGSTWSCVLPAPPALELQAWADVVLTDGGIAWSCVATAACAYQLRGSLVLVAPDGGTMQLVPAWNQKLSDHCWSCNASWNSTYACNPNNAPYCAP